MDIVNKNQLITAQQATQVLTSAIGALNKVNTQALGFDAYAFKQVSSMVALLEKFDAKNNAVIDQAQTQYNNRPEHIINAAAIRICSIPDDILLAQKNIKAAIEMHDLKTADLRKQSFSESEIKSIVVFPQEEIDRNNIAIAELTAEQNNLHSFISDAPRYDVSLVDMERLKPYLQHCNQAG